MPGVQKQLAIEGAEEPIIWQVHMDDSEDEDYQKATVTYNEECGEDVIEWWTIDSLIRGPLDNHPLETLTRNPQAVYIPSLISFISESWLLSQQLGFRNH